MSSTNGVTLIFSKGGQLLMQFGDTAALAFGTMALAASCYALHQSESVDYSKSMLNNVFLIGYRPHSGQFERGVFLELSGEDVEKMITDYMNCSLSEQENLNYWSEHVELFIKELAAIRKINTDYAKKLGGECCGK